MKLIIWAAIISVAAFAHGTALAQAAAAGRLKTFGDPPETRYTTYVWMYQW